MAIALGGGLCGWIALQAVAGANYVAWANSGDPRVDYAGRGPRWTWVEPNYAGRRWAESETLRYIRDNLGGAVIYANQPLQAHYHLDGNADVRSLPIRRVLTEDTYNPLHFTRWAAINQGAYIAWFDYDDPRKGRELMRLRAREGLEPVGEFADGVAFRVNSEYKPTPGTNPWLDAYIAIATGEAALRSAGEDFEVYVHQDMPVYFRSPCAGVDTWGRFFLHIYAEDAADLPADRRGEGYEDLYFDFKRRGALFGDNCVALAPLPRYEYERIRTGQYDIDGSGRALWEANVAGTAARRYWQAHKAAADGDYGGAAARSDFVIYLDDSAESKTLVYVRESCTADDTRARFFLHVFPDDAADLSADGARHGFDNLDFEFAEYGADLGGACVAVRELPEYGVERARTGQYVSGEGALWRVEFGVDGGE